MRVVSTIAGRPLYAAAAFSAWLALAVQTHAQPQSISLQNTSQTTYGAVRVADSPLLEPQQFTVDVRIRPDGPGFQGSDSFGCHLVTKFVEGAGEIFASAYAIRWSPTTGRVNLAIAHQFDGAGIVLYSNSIVAVGSTARVTVTFDGATAKLYIDGVLDAEAATSFSSIFYAASDLRFGAGNGPSGFARRFQGMIDDVRIWNRALDSEEIVDTGGCQPTEPAVGLVAAWSFVSGSFLDTSGNGHDGTPEGLVAFVNQPAGDVNCSCTVDLTDLAVLLAHFGQSSGATGADGDLDGNGNVDLSDLAALLAHFGQTCP